MLCLLLTQVTPAAAQQEEIIVTARKRPEPLQEIPLKVDVLTDDGAEIGINSLQNLMTRVPGLYFESGWGGLFSSPTLRGQQASPAGDLNVGIFIDGVYQANPEAVDLGPTDIARVEVAHGPQSALFGHSTFAGAIHFISEAPRDRPELGFSVETGSDSYAGLRGYLSGPIGNALLGRLAIASSAADGTYRNGAAPTDRLGDVQRQSIVLQAVTRASSQFEARVSARVSETELAQPPVATLTYRDYNCGAIEPASAAWSYYCGPLPIATHFASSPGIPDSDARTGQLAVVLSGHPGGGTLTSTSSYYRSNTDAYRDMDASGAGNIFGVCTQGTSCPEAVGTWPIDRLISLNEVWRKRRRVSEWSQEIRYSKRASARLEWTLGAVTWETRDRDEVRLGVERGNLQGDQRLTALLPLTPAFAGPAVIENAALVDDPLIQQVTQSLDREVRRTLALFGALELELGDGWQAGFEIRATDEQRKLDNQIADFAEGFGTAIPALRFRDSTPRISLRYSRSPVWSAYVSAARGSQSGGTNPIPGLPPDEQSFDPEFNWTYEVAARYRPASRPLGVDATVFYVDWYDAQIQGFGQTAARQITLNTAGLRTRGIELNWFVEPFSVFRAELGLAWVDPEFRAGSDDAGSNRFCGLTRGGYSSFCSYGPARNGPPTIVTYIDGNVPARVPRRTWYAALEFAPRIGSERLRIRIDSYHQDDVFDRAINGARFGERLMVDMQMSYDFGRWRVSLWGRNLTNERYVRALSSRGQVYSPVTPRPLDAIYGDARRFGLSASFSISARS